MDDLYEGEGDYQDVVEGESEDSFFNESQNSIDS